MKILQTFNKPLERKVTEAVLINNSKAHVKMNSKAEFHQPTVARVITTREPKGQGPDHVGRKHRGASPAEAASAGQIKPGGANWAREEARAGPILGLSPLVSFIHPCIYFQN